MYSFPLIYALRRIIIKIINKNNNPVNTIIVFIHGFSGNKKSWLKQNGGKELIESILDLQLFVETDIGFIDGALNPTGLNTPFDEFDTDQKIEGDIYLNENDGSEKNGEF